MRKEDKQQFTLRITRANPTELVAILYEMLLCYLEDGYQALDSEEEVLFHEAIRKARGCLNELIGSLDVRYQPAPEIQQLLLFCVRRLALGEARKDRALLMEAEKVIRPLKDAYAQLAKQNTAPPVMNNAQTVYAGLTYGRSALTENMTNQGANRGMLA